MLEELKKKVYNANMLLPKYGLVTFTWGNVSGIDKERKYFVIKPSGIEYDKLTPDDMVVMDLEGNRVEGRYNPSSDTKTHLILYQNFENIGGIVHTHSPYATGFAQAGADIACMGTTQCDYFCGDIPCVRHLTKEELDEDYELNTGKVIVETFRKRDINPEYIPGCICKSHGPFCWGKDANTAVHNAVVMEEVAKMNLFALTVNPNAAKAPQYLKDKHFLRKHGKNAYYGNQAEIR